MTESSMRILAAAMACLATAASLPAAGGEGVRWHDGDLASALAAAREQDRLVLVDAWAEWCRYCHVMDDELWPRKDVADQVERLAVPVKVEVDARRGVGLEVKQRYGIEGLPLVLVLSPADGGELARVEGLVDATSLETALRAAALAHAPDREVAKLPASPATRLEIARGLLANDYARAAGVAARGAAQADADCSADVRDDAALLAAAAARARGRPAEALPALEQAARRCLHADRGSDLWRRLLELAPAERRPELLESRARLRPGDVDGQLSWARWLTEHDQPDRARAVLERARERNPRDPGPLAALADLLARRGEPERALALIERAIELAPYDDTLRTRRLELARQARAP
jgi:thioredoxin-like negative regulator of GroEL